MSSSFQGGQTICILPIFGIPFRNYKQVDKLTTIVNLQDEINLPLLVRKLQLTIISIVEILPSIPKENINFVLKNILASYFSGNPLIHGPVHCKM
jgi:hypothetical protein